MGNKYHCCKYLSISEKCFLGGGGSGVEKSGSTLFGISCQSNLAAVDALKERSLLGQEDHQRSEIVLKSCRVAHYFVFP